jgi:hypothetical protein
MFTNVKGTPCPSFTFQKVSVKAFHKSSQIQNLVILKTVNLKKRNKQVNKRRKKEKKGEKKAYLLNIDQKRILIIFIN